MRRAAAIVMATGLFLAAWTPAMGQTCVSEAFAYPCVPTPPATACNLEGNGGWTGAAGYVLLETTEHVLLNFANGGGTGNKICTLGGLSCVACAADGKLTVSLKVQADSTPSAGGFAWSIEFREPTGKELARWYGNPKAATPRIGGQTLPGFALSTTGWDELKAVIDTTNRTTYWYHTLDGGTEVLDGSKVWPPGLGVPQGTNQLGSITIQHWDIAGLAGTLLIDDVSVARCPGSCFSDVDPLASENIMAKMFWAAEGAATSFPPTHVYTITNTSSVAQINWTAQEAKADGTTAGVDYPWFSISPASGGPLTTVAPGNTADVTVSFVPGALAPGLYAGNILLDDDCGTEASSMRTVQLALGFNPWFAEAFQYPSGNLDGHGGWIGGMGGIVVDADPDNPDNQVMKVIMDPNAAGGDATSAVIDAPADPCENGLIVVEAKIKASPTGTTGKGWIMTVDSPSGANLAFWEGSYNTARGRNAGAGLATPSATVTSAQWHTLRAEIDVRNNLTTYKFDGVALGAVNPQTHGEDLGTFQANVEDFVDSISITRVENGPLTGYTLFDDVTIVSCDTPDPQCTANVYPWRYAAGFTQLPWAPDSLTAPNPASRDYIFSNEGLVDIAGYSVDTVNRDGTAHVDYPWMTLSKTSGGPLAPQTQDPLPVTATFNSGQAPGAHLGYLKFTDSCSGLTFMRAVKLNVGNCISEVFDDYANGPLTDAPGWEVDPAGTFGGGTSLGVASPIEVNSGVLRITGNKLSPAAGQVNVTAQHRRIDNCPVCEGTDGLVRVTMKIRGHSGSSALWEVHFTPLGGTDLAAWTGTAGSVQPRAEAEGEGTLSDLTGGWDTLEARINVHDYDAQGVPARSTEFYFNGVLTDTIVHTWPPTPPDVYNEPRVRYIKVVRVGNDTTADADPMIEIDDVVLSRCERLCNTPFADTDADGDVDQADFAVLQRCFTAGATPIPADPAYCVCFDKGADNPAGDNDIDNFDFEVFENCASGSGVPADPNCG